MANIRAEVATTALMLDRMNPGYAAHIDVSILDFNGRNAHTSCILAQLHGGSYLEGLYVLKARGVSQEEREGFFAPADSLLVFGHYLSWLAPFFGFVANERMKAAWRYEIKKRLRNPSAYLVEAPPKEHAEQVEEPHRLAA